MVIDEAAPWNVRWRMLLVLAMSCAMVLGWTGIAAAETRFTLTIPIDTSRGAPEGSVIKLAEEGVPDEVVGRSCTVTALAENQRSVHPNNNLIVSSGDSQLVLPDVEREGGVITEAAGVLVLGESVTVHLEMGEDEGFSGGLDVVIDCEPRTGRIIVVKQVTDGSDTGQSFDFTADYGDGEFSLGHGEQNDSGELEPGTYAVEEVVPDGWTLKSATCDDESSPDAIDLSAGETITCTFLNAEDGIDSEVRAAIELTVDGRCEVVEGDGVGFVDVTISVDDGATVVVTDSSGEVEGSLSSDGTIEVDEGATYNWEATLSEGFELPAGAESDGVITIETCSMPETLPFTGPSDGLVVLAAVLLGLGVSIITLAPPLKEQ